MRSGHECNGGQSSPGSPFYGDLAQRRWWTRGGETWRSPISRSAEISVLRSMARWDPILSCHQSISNPCRGPVVHRARRDASEWTRVYQVVAVGNFEFHASHKHGARNLSRSPLAVGRLEASSPSGLGPRPWESFPNHWLRETGCSHPTISQGALPGHQ